MSLAIDEAIDVTASLFEKLASGLLTAQEMGYDRVPREKIGWAAPFLAGLAKQFPSEAATAHVSVAPDSTIEVNLSFPTSFVSILFEHDTDGVRIECFDEPRGSEEIRECAFSSPQSAVDHLVATFT